MTTQTNNDPFSNWDIRREANSSRPAANSEDKKIEKTDFDVFNDNSQTEETPDSTGDSLDTPPFFKRRRK